MLTVKTFLKETGNKGIGLFAAELIPKGAVWWRDDPKFNRVINERQAEALPEVAKEFLTTYGVLDNRGDWYVCLDNARFVNHSDSPNTVQAYGVGPSLPGDWITTREIAIGEEITSDYRVLCETCRNGLCFINSEK